MMRTLFVMILLGLICTGVRADEVEVIPLHHRTAEQLIPTLQPLLDQGGALSAAQNKLIVRSSRRNIEEIRRVLVAIDTVPRRLMIYVRQTRAAAIEDNRVGASGRIGSDNAHAGLNERAGRTGPRVSILDSRSASDESNISQVQAIEGSTAYIAVGQSVAVPVTSTTQTGSGSIVQNSSTEYRDITTGFYVVPRLNGDMVSLDISPQRDTPGHYGEGSADIQHIGTNVRARLGEWFELGGIRQSSAGEGRGVLSTRALRDHDARSVWVKVEELQ